jgi:TrmH family RNA methyltransferase
MLDASLPLREVLRNPVPSPYTLIFGNEGSGLPPEFASFGQPVRIESNDKVDSLNLAIAAGIAIYKFSAEGARSRT